MMVTMKKSFSKEEQRIKLNRLKEAIDAEQLLISLGFDITNSTPKEVRAPCKIHGGKNKTSFRMDKITKNWICFSSGCHNDIGYDVISLVMHMLNLSFPNAIRYLENIAGVDINNEAAYLKFKRAKDRHDFIDQMIDNRQVPSSLLSEEYLKSFKKFRSDFFTKDKNGGFSEEILDLFEIGGGYVDRYGFQRDVIPIRDVDGNLKAYSCRDITGNIDESYKYILTKGFDKDKVLYNLNNAKSCMDETRTLIVVEGFKSVWNLYRFGYKNVVACIGSHITPGQQSLLYTYAFNIILLLDMDEAGVKGTRDAIKSMKGKIGIRPIFLPYLDKDPGDLNIDEIKMLLGGING